MKAQQQGQAMIEYSIVCAFVVLALTKGQPDLIDTLIIAIKTRLGGFGVLLGAP